MEKKEEAIMRIGVDFDDVLLGCNESLALFHNARYGSNYKREDVRSWKLEEVWHCSREEARRRIREWYGSREHSESKPIKGALEAVTALSKTHELHLITARFECAKGCTEEWLKRYFPHRFSSIHFTGRSSGLSCSKVRACFDVGAELFVEDSLFYASSIASAGIPVLLFDCPWNQGRPPYNVTRVYGWKDVLSFVESCAVPVK